MPTPIPIRVWRALRLVLHFAWIGLGAALAYPLISEDRRIQLQRLWSHRLLRILAVELDAQPGAAPPGALIVVNHVSWLDIFTINALRPGAFISKSEVRQWPFVGWLAARHGTIFLRRGSRGHAKTVNAEIDALLNANRDVVVFPEGTTTDGTHLLGFHAALLQPAIETGRAVQPFALSYHSPDGRVSIAPSYAGDTTLMQCFVAILASRRLIAKLTPAAPIASTGTTRRALSQAAHAAVEGVLLTRPGFHHANNPLEKSRDPQAE